MSAQLAAERATKSPVSLIESVPIIETFRGETIWEGMVDVFKVSKPPPQMAYAWPVKAANGGVEYVAVLGEPPIDSPLAAVRAWIASQSHSQTESA